MKLAIMQPYFLPYIGYFQLINSVDKFVFYDDVNFIKNGWINRNRIIINNNLSYITIQLKNASSFKLIKDIEFTDNRCKILKTVEQAYKKAPYFSSVFDLIFDILNCNVNTISELAIYSVKSVSRYLSINTKFLISSVEYNNQSMKKEDRLIDICKHENASHYNNSIGGIELYKKEYFAKYNITLKFVKTNEIYYKQFSNDFIPNLSIIDVLMFNSVEEVNLMLDNFTLI